MERKCALVTGSASGIGAAAILRLAADGFNVVINYHSDKKCEDAAKLAYECEKLDVKAVCIQADVSKSEECDYLVKSSVDNFGKLDVLVNNAGILQLSPMLKMTNEMFDNLMKTNAYSVFFMMRSAANVMRKQHSGKIINISSVGGLYGSPWSIGYAASKGAIISMTKTAAKELAISHITVNAIAPGGCDTGMLSYNEQQLKDQLKYVTLRRTCTPDEIAGAISFLSSNDSSYITGHVLEVSGGVMM